MTRCLIGVFLIISSACVFEPQPAAPDAALPPPPVDAVPFTLDLFAGGHTLRFAVSQEQAEAMERTTFDNEMADEYSLGGASWADDLQVTNASTGATKHYGKIELRFVGQSTRRPWARIPNFRLDMDEFTPGQQLAGYEHLRLNNGQVSGIYREAIANRVWATLGYPTPRIGFAWAEAPGQWGTIRVPYTLVEVYKRAWCERAFGAGNCKNMWEGVGSFRDVARHCQINNCENTRMDEMVSVLENTPMTPGYEAALAPYIDWDAYRSFQCLSWITGTGDDLVHNNNNIVPVERADGKFQFLPYSIDISAGQQWYPQVGLLGQTPLAMGCQNDPQCWRAMLARCDALLTAFEQARVVETIVDPVVAEVARFGMEREGDTARAELLRAWYGNRAAELRSDPVWTQQPCLTQETCAALGDERTVCTGICVPPDVTLRRTALKRATRAAVHVGRP